MEAVGFQSYINVATQGETIPTNLMVGASSCLHTLRPVTFVALSMRSSEVWFLAEECRLALLMLVLFKDCTFLGQGIQGSPRGVHVLAILIVEASSVDVFVL